MTSKLMAFNQQFSRFAFIGYDSGRTEPLRLVEYVNPEEELDRRGAEVHGITSYNFRA